MKLRGFFSRSNWRIKAVIRSKTIKSLNKRNKELVISRDKIKDKVKRLSLKNDALEETINGLKNELKKT